MDWSAYLDAEQPRFVDELIDFVRIPSVSAKSQNAVDLRRAADWVVSRLKAAGIEHAQVMPTKGHPVVYGEWLGAGTGQPTILIYGHFDVQPAEPLELWDSPPFEPELRDGKLWGRGASDDKGGLLASIIAVEALFKAHGTLPVNVKFLYEGEEEVGSASLRDFVAANTDRLKADMAFSADGLQWAPDQPQIMQAMKATVSCEIKVTGPRSDQHSGLHGGGIANPAVALAHILASMKSADGLVTIDGFYDDVAPLSQATRDQIALLPYDEDEYLSRTGAPSAHGEPGYTVMERIGARPMLDVNGLTSGWQGDGSKTVLPALATAKITCRLVHAQSAAKVLEAIRIHVEAHCPPGVTVAFFAADREGQPFSVPQDHAATALAGEVLEEVYGKTPYRIWAGGSIPAFSPFLDLLGLHAVMLGFSHGDENLHAPNEFFRLDVFRRGQEVYARLLERAAGRLRI
jgi:acetylornithine deacetylase/succinyl-diaminopimelate desuccinylase-like protein